MGFAGTSRLGILALVTMSIGVFAACTGESNLGPVPIQKSTIQITPSVLDFEALADIGQLKATRTDGQGRPSNLNQFVWRSLSPDIAQVDGAGRVVSLSQGTALIEVSVSGASARAEVVVDQVPVQFAISSREDTLDAVGQAFQVNLEARDRNGFRIGRRSFDWSSDDPRIVSVDDEGLVTSLEEGQTKIRVRKRGRNDSTRVTVRREKNVVSVSPRLDTLKSIGERVKLSAVETDGSGSTVKTSGFSWSSSASSVARVLEDGIVEAVSAGRATITATSGGRSGSATIVVYPSVDRISITPTSASLGAPGQTVQMTASGMDGEGQSVLSSSFSWSTDRPSVATVDNSGRVTGKGPGTAQIVATASTGAKGFASVSVGQISLNVAPSVDTLKNVGDATSFAIYPTDSQGATATCPNPVWSSNNTSVATVSQFGSVVAKSVGTAMIIVAACGVQDTASVVVTGGEGGGGTTSPPPPPPPSSGSAVLPELPRLTPNTARPSVSRTVRAHNGSELLSAIANAQAGDEILLDPGTVYTSNTGFRLPARGDGGWVIIRTDMSVSTGARIDSTRNFARLTCGGSNCAPVRADQGGDHGWRFEVVEILTGVDNVNSAVYLHTGDSNPPRRFVFDRVYIHAGQASWNLRRCVLGNAADLAVINSVLTECHERNNDSQGFVAWNTPGPILIQNNLISASSIPILFGGADPKDASMVPSDITIARNHVWRPQSWRGGPWTIKNLFELKISKRIHVWGNVFENHWRDAQQGYAILLKSTNQNGGIGDWSVTEDVTFERNILRNVDMGFNLARATEGAIHPMSRVLIENILIDKLGPNSQNGDGTSRTFLIQGPDDLTIRNITSLNPGVNSTFYWATKSGNNAMVERILVGSSQYGNYNGGTLPSVWYQFQGSYAEDNDCSKYTAGWTCGSTPPSGVGADMARVNSATNGVVR